MKINYLICGGNAVDNLSRFATGESLAYNVNKLKNGKIAKGISKVKNGKMARKIKNLPKNSRLINAGLSASRYYARGMKSKMKNKLKNGHPVKAAIRTAAGVAGGLTAGTIGLATGIASGDINKATQNAMAGIGLGYKSATGLANGAQNTFGIEGTKEVMDRAFEGDEAYEEKQRQKYIKDLQKDFNYQNKMIKIMGNEDKAKDVIKNVLPTCAEYGFVKPEEVASISNMVNDGYEMKKAMAIAKKSKEYGKDTNHLSAKDDDEYNKTLRNDLKKKGYSESDAEVGATGIRKDVDKYNKYLYKYNKK